MLMLTVVAGKSGNTELGEDEDHTVNTKKPKVAKNLPPKDMEESGDDGDLTIDEDDGEDQDKGMFCLYDRSPCVSADQVNDSH